MVSITVLDLTEDPIRYIAEQTRDDPASHLVVFPTARNIRHFHRTLSKMHAEEAVVSPYCYEMNEFVRHCLDPGGKALVSKHLRPFYLQRAIRKVERERLDELLKGDAGEMQDDFIRFAATGARILRFFDEVFAERISTRTLTQASLYTDYEKHIGVLEDIADAYREVLSDDGFVDPMFLKKEGGVRTDRIGRFEKIFFLVSGYLTRFETDLLAQTGEDNHVDIILRYEGDPDGQTKKLFDACGSEPVRGKETGLPSAIEIRAYEEAAGQFGFIVHAVEHALRSGIAPEDIVVVLPDGNMKRIMFSLDRKRIFNYAMGLEMKDTVWYSLFRSIESLFRERVDRVRYRSEPVMNLLKHPFIQNLPSGERWTDTCITKIKYENRLILKEDDFCITESFKDLFSKIKDIVTHERGYGEFLIAFADVIDYTIERLNQDFVETLSQSPEFAESRDALTTYLYQSAVLPYDRAYEGTDPVRHLNYLIGQLAGLTYHDVAGGFVTVMGMLETRNISFRAVIIPDMNEEMMPPRSEKEMFLNTNIRQGLGIPDYQDRENLARYYFNALIKNADMVFLSYVERDERSIRSRLIEEILIETGHTGEDPPGLRERRQYEDLLFETRSIEAELSLPDVIQKDRTALSIIEGMTFSPYTFRTYRLCSYKFYLLFIKRLDEAVEIAEEFAPVDVGNILHGAFKSVYQDVRAYDDAGKLYEQIREAVNEVSGRYDIFQISPHARFERDVLSDKLFRFAESDVQRFKDGWRPEYIEQDISMVFEDMKISGRIDRVDVREGNGRAFIIDYKYSKVSRLKNLRYDESFSEFQLPLYRMMLSEEHPDLHVEGFGYYDLRETFKLVTVKEHGSPDDFEAVLAEVIHDIRSPEKDFVKTDDLRTCMYCGFARLCGRQR